MAGTFTRFRSKAEARLRKLPKGIRSAFLVAPVTITVLTQTILPDDYFAS